MNANPSQSVSSARARILVVDDEAGPRESLRLILAPRYTVMTAAEASEAIECLRTNTVDVVTVNLSISGMKGDELIQTVRDEFPHVGVIVTTGCASVESAVERAVGELASRKRLVNFLEGIGDILGRKRSAAGLIDDLADDATLHDRLREALAEPVLGGSRDGNESLINVADSIAVLEVLAEVIEQRDVFMLGHSRRVAQLPALLSERLCLAAAQRALVRIASFMHDIGKVGVSSEVIQSDDVLNSTQRKHLEEHPSIGERLVRPLGFSGGVAATIRHHHERWDGRGYPDGLAGEEIPLGARIIAVADSYDAMTCTRPYQAASTEEDALAELEKEAGRQFDPQLVKQFSEIIRAGAALLEKTEGGNEA